MMEVKRLKLNNGDVFQLGCDHSLTLSRSVFLQRLKKEFLSFSASFSPHCRKARLHLAASGWEGTRLQAGRGGCSCEAGEGVGTVFG